MGDANSLESITVDPLYPVLDENDDCPNFELPLTIWSRNKSNADFVNPCTVDMRGDRSKISFHFSHLNYPNAPDARLTSMRIDGKLDNSPQRVVLTNGDYSGEYAESGVFTTTLAPPSYKPSEPLEANEAIPWGIKDQVTWTVSYSYEYTTNSGPVSHTSSFDIKHHLEVYAVTSCTDSYKTRPPHYQGMPRAALEFYLITARENYPYQDQDGYVRSIVEAVHADTGNAYDVWNGATVFSAEGTSRSGYFDIGAWARHLRPNYRLSLSKMLHADGQRPPEFVGHFINCYDQAGAVWAGVSLALRNQQEAYQLIWRFVQPYGYIKATKLVGWWDNSGSATGDAVQKTDSPYFGGVPGLQLFEGSQNDQSSRTSFWNHAFLEYKGQPLDATCGPHVGKTSLDVYLGGIDLAAGLVAKEVTTTRWYEHMNGIDATPPTTKEFIQARDYGGATPKYVLEKYKPWQLDPRDTFRGSDGVPENCQGDYGMLRFGYNININTDPKLASELWKALKAQKGVGRPEEVGSWVLIASQLRTLGCQLASTLAGSPDVGHIPATPMFINRLTKYVAHLSWSVIPSSQTRRVSVGMFILPSCSQAADFFIMRMFPRSDEPKSVYKILPLLEGQGGLCAVHEDNGRGQLLCVTRNVVYIIEGLGNNEALKPYQDVVKKLFTNNERATSLQTDAITTTISDEDPQTGIQLSTHAFQIQPNGQLGLKVNASGGALFSYDQQHKWILTPTVTPTGSKESTGSAIFEFRARNPGKDVFKLVVCGESLAPMDEDHLDVQEIEVQVTVE